MTWLTRMLRRARYLLRRGALDRAMDEEIRFHIEKETERHLSEGLPEAEARRRAHIGFGGVERTKARTREARGVAPLEDLIRDVRLAVRSLRKAPAFVVAVVLMLALGIGATTAIFSVVDGVLLRPLPYPEPDRVVQVRHVSESGNSQIQLSYPNFLDLSEGSSTLRGLGAYAPDTQTLNGAEGAARIGTAQVTSHFFEVLGTTPTQGRLFGAVEFEGAASGAAVVSYGFWKDRLGQPLDLSTTIVRLGDRRYQVVGVLPEGVVFPAGTDVWLPSTATLANQTRTAHNFRVIARLRDGVTLDAARADVSAVARGLKARFGDDTQMADVELVPLREELVGGVRSELVILLAAAGFLLLIALVNTTNLLLARIAARRRQLSIRLALGASGRRLATHLLAEAMVIALSAGTLGFLLAASGVPTLLSFEPGDLPRLDDVHASWTVFGFALVVSLVVAMAIALLPLARAHGLDLRAALGERRASQGGGSAGNRARKILAGSQIALSLALLVGAGLLARSFTTLMALDPGYRTEGGVVMDLWFPRPDTEPLVPGTGIRDPRGEAEAQLGLLQQDILERIRALPGVDEAGGVNAFPLSGGGASGTFTVLESPDELGDLLEMRFEDILDDPARLQRVMQLLQDPAQSGYGWFRIASDGYFETMDIPLIRGRLFEQTDGPGAPHVAVISQSLADTRWPGEDPIGKFIEFGNMDGDLRPFTVVGIVGDVRDRSLEADPNPTFYGDYRQRPASTYEYHVVMRGAASAATMIASTRQVMGEIAPDVAVRFRTLEQVFSSALSERRFSLFLLATFSAAALLLATLGIYGVIAYLASQRAQEMGIRMALGATKGGIRSMVVREALAMAIVGIAAGLVIGGGTSAVLRSMLYRVTPLDPATYAAAAATLLLVAVASAWVPATRAAAAEPTRVLRAE